MSRTVTWLIVLVLTVASGAVAGVFGSRWTPRDMAEAAQRLDRLPNEFGQWELIDEMPFEDEVAAMLQCVRSTNRSYRHRESGDTVHVAIFVGPPGPASVHTPEICYSSQGCHLAAAGERRRFPAAAAADGRPSSGGHEFRKTVFLPDIRQPMKLIVYYGWCDGRWWQAPDQPRFAFGGAAYLYKLQLAAQIVPRLDKDDDDPCKDFLREFLPALSGAGFYAPPPLDQQP